MDVTVSISQVNFSNTNLPSVLNAMIIYDQAKAESSDLESHVLFGYCPQATFILSPTAQFFDTSVTLLSNLLFFFS